VLIVITGFHGILYAGRALILPVLVARWGQDALDLSSSVTLYARVLYSVVLPMVMLALVREEGAARLTHLATTDHLTELGNRRWFFTEGAEMIAGAQGDLAPAGVRHRSFQSINDRFGHATGDKVLKSFARVLREVVGPDALLARIGGEEFAIMLPGRDRAAARRIGQAVLDGFADSAVVSRTGVAVSATVSGGWPNWRRPRAMWPACLAWPTARSIAPRRWGAIAWNRRCRRWLPRQRWRLPACLIHRGG
jgi:diguanylate cyclase (GGDEF)-like protein